MQEKYNVIIIGAGIGGLTCGCYLAKAGLKVLIIEQHDKPGGCCTSFERNGYRFDAGPHYLCSLREDGVLHKILGDFGLFDRIKFLTNDPIDKIITPYGMIFIRKKKEKTKQELSSQFPNEKNNIEYFFKFICDSDLLHIYSKTKGITLDRLLNCFFKDKGLKTTLALLALGNLGLPSSRLSALVATIFYKESILDGGYYPLGGMQVFPNILVDKFKEYNGEIIFSKRAEKITIKKNKAMTVKLKDSVTFETDFVVANNNVSTLFQKMLNFKTKESKIVDKLKVSSSVFGVYLGLNRKINISPTHFSTWYSSNDNLDAWYKNTTSLHNPDWILLSLPSAIDPTLCPKDKSVLRIFTQARYATEKEWEQCRNETLQRTLDKASLLIPSLKSCIEIEETATPRSFFNFTGNKNGAAFGWAAIPDQVDMKIFPNKTSIGNLYLASHWVTNGLGQSGIPTVAFCGKYTATQILKNIRKGLSNKK